MKITQVIVKTRYRGHQIWISNTNMLPSWILNHDPERERVFEFCPYLKTAVLSVERLHSIESSGEILISDLRRERIDFTRKIEWRFGGGEILLRVSIFNRGVPNVLDAFGGVGVSAPIVSTIGTPRHGHF